MHACQWCSRAIPLHASLVPVSSCGPARAERQLRNGLPREGPLFTHVTDVAAQYLSTLAWCRFHPAALPVRSDNRATVSPGEGPRFTHVNDVVTHYLSPLGWRRSPGVKACPYDLPKWPMCPLCSAGGPLGGALCLFPHRRLQTHRPHISPRLTLQVQGSRYKSSGHTQAKPAQAKTAQAKTTQANRATSVSGGRKRPGLVRRGGAAQSGAPVGCGGGFRVLVV